MEEAGTKSMQEDLSIPVKDSDVAVGGSAAKTRMVSKAGQSLNACVLTSDTFSGIVIERRL